MGYDNQSWKLQSKLLVAIQTNNVNACKDLINCGVDCDQTFRINSQERIALCLGAENGSYEIVSLLLKYGASVNRRDSKGYSALHYAVEIGFISIIELLLENRADVNVSDNFGRTPLHLAAARNDPNIIEKLLSRGADVNKLDSYNKGVLAYACDSHSVNKESVKIIISHGAPVDKMDNLDQIPLLYALKLENTPFEVVEMLVSHGSRLNIKAKDGRTPLHMILDHRNSSKKWKILNLIIRHSDVHMQNSCGQDALALACLNRDLTSAKILLRNGANPNSKDFLGLSALDNSIGYEYDEIVNLLLDSGATRDINQLSRINRPHYCKHILKTHYVKRLTNPPRLTEIARARLWKLFGSQTCDWLKKNHGELPITMDHYLTFHPL